MLMAFPLGVWAQDDYTDEEEDDTPAVRTFTVKQKKYETRVVRGQVLDAATRQPVAGAIVRAAEIDGYSVLTEDNGSYELKAPVFATALYVSATDYNPVRIGLAAGEEQRTAFLYSTSFTAEYGATTNVRGDQTSSTPTPLTSRTRWRASSADTSTPKGATAHRA